MFGGEYDEVVPDPRYYLKIDGLPKSKIKPYVDIRKSFNATLKKCDIMNFRFHDLRHTFASHLVMSGVDLNRA